MVFILLSNSKTQKANEVLVKGSFDRKYSNETQEKENNYKIRSLDH